MSVIGSRLPTKQASKFRNIYFYSILYFLMCFALLFAFRNVGVFSDEYDNIVGGMTVAKGLDVYKAYYSQHTPLMYYLCAIFKLLGANGLFSFRLYFYAFLSICFTAIYIRYNKIFGNKVMILFPIILITSYFLTDNNFMYMVLSDQVQAVALSILFLEWLQYIKTREFNISNAIMLSIGIFCSIGVAFVSIYFVAIVCAAIIVMEIHTIRKTDANWFTIIKIFFQKHWTTIIIIILPFLVLCLYYSFTGNLHNFYYQAYKLNKEIYSRYNGMVSPIKTFFSTIDFFFAGFGTYCNKLTANFANSSRALMNYFFDLAFIIWMYRKNKFASVVTTLLIFSTCIRGIAGFHSTAFWAVSAIIIAFQLNLLFERIKNEIKEGSKYRFSQVGIMILLMSIICVPYMSNFSKLVPSRNDLKQAVYDKSSREYYIDKILKPNEGFFVSDLEEGLYVNTNRISSIKASCLVPWFSDVFQQDIISDLESTHTKLIICDPDSKVWGYDFSNFAYKLYEYIEKNYKLLQCGATHIYIRDQYYDEVVKQLGLETLVFAPSDARSVPVIGPLRDGKQVSQVFVANSNEISSVSIQFGTYARTNHSKLQMTIEKANTGNVLYTSDIDVSNLSNNAVNKIQLSSKLSIQKGEQYKITFKARETTDNDFVTIHRTMTNPFESAGYAVVDDKKQDYNLDIGVFGN